MGLSRASLSLCVSNCLRTFDHVHTRITAHISTCVCVTTNFSQKSRFFVPYNSVAKGPTLNVALSRKFFTERLSSVYRTARKIFVATNLKTIARWKKIVPRWLITQCKRLIPTANRDMTDCHRWNGDYAKTSATVVRLSCYDTLHCIHGVNLFSHFMIRTPMSVANITGHHQTTSFYWNVRNWCCFWSETSPLCWT